MRDRLIELIASMVCDGYSSCDECVPHSCEKCYANNCRIAEIADYLLANGVIAPPCKVGDIIYALTYDRKDYMPLKVTSRESLVRWMDEDQFGNELFTTREEAEQVLAERKVL